MNLELKWVVLGLVTVQLFSGYWQGDLPVPLYIPLKNYFTQTMSESEFEFYYSMLFTGYSLLSMFVLFVIGRWCDKYTAARIALVFSLLEVFGMGLITIGVSTHQIQLMIIGRAVLGLGNKGLYVCMNAIVVKWFANGGVAFALALIQSLGLMGSVVNNFVSLDLYYRTSSIVVPFSLGLCLAILDFIAAIVIWRLSVSSAITGTALLPQGQSESPKADSSKESIVQVLRAFPKAFWLINLVSFFTYCLFPAFNNISQALLVYRECGGDCCQVNITTCELETAAISKVSGLQGIPYTTFAILIPFAGWLIDFKGQNGHVLSTGCVLFGLAQGLLMTQVESIYALVLQGIALTCFGASFWSSIPLIVDESVQGFAYSLSIWVQSVAMMVSPLAVASLAVNYPGYDAVGFYLVVIGVFSFAVSLVLGFVDHRDGLGLNIRNWRPLDQSRIPGNAEESLAVPPFPTL